MLPKRLQLVSPVALEPRQPGLHSNKAIGTQPITPSPPILFTELNVDQPTRAKRPQMPAHRGRAHPYATGDLTGAQRTLAQQVDDPAASWVGQGRESHIKVVHAAVNLYIRALTSQALSRRYPTLQAPGTRTTAQRHTAVVRLTAALRIAFGAKR